MFMIHWIGLEWMDRITLKRDLTEKDEFSIHISAAWMS